MKDWLKERSNHFYAVSFLIAVSLLAILGVICPAIVVGFIVAGGLVVVYFIAYAMVDIARSGI